MYFFIVLWGYSFDDGKKICIYVVIKFFIFIQVSGLVMLVVIFGLVFVNFNVIGVIIFDYVILLKIQLSFYVEWLLMFGFFVVFVVKMLVVLVYFWLLDVYVQVFIVGFVDFVGILLKIVVYGLICFVLLLFFNVLVEFVLIVMWFGIIGIFYGVLLFFVQIDIKCLVVYFSVLYMGFVMIGIYFGSQVVLQGVVVQMIVYGFFVVVLFIFCGQFYECLYICDMCKMGGLWLCMFYLLVISLFFVLVLLGLFGIGNFVGEFLILIGVFKVVLVIIVIVIFGLVFVLVYLLIMIYCVYFGFSQFDELIFGFNVCELSMVFGLVVLLVLFGVYLQLVLDIFVVSMYGVQ